MPPENSTDKPSVEERLLASIDLIEASQACALLRIETDDPEGAMQAMTCGDAIITLVQNGKTRLPQGADFVERILLRWGPPASTRAWSQWGNRAEKEIVELRIDPREPPIPGFSAFVARVSELRLAPLAWQAALGSVRGVYLLVADGGEQYVGSAAGQDGFMGRWRAYAANGHGGNVLLRERGHRDYIVSILEVASPDMSRDDIVAREAFWKDKLGARAHGLNAN